MKYASWEETETGLEWQDLGTFKVEDDWNEKVTESVGDSRSWQSGPKRYVNPGILTQKVLQEVVTALYCPAKPGQPSLHARHLTRLERPVEVGEPLRIKARIPTKFIKRDRQYAVYEAWVLGTDDVPKLYWKQTRMVSRVGD